MLCENISVSSDGHLLFAGQDTVELAKKYGTPLYLMDEDMIRKKCRQFMRAVKDNFGESALVLYASKANCFKRMHEIVAEEGLGIDVVSRGEIYTALKAGFNLNKAYFHSNNKTDEDIAYAMDNKVGYFVADNLEEIKIIELEAEKRGIVQKVILRLTPGIDPHTYEAVSTGNVDSKFGAAIETGQAEELTLETVAHNHISLEGFHCHVGSQLFEEDVSKRAAEVMLNFICHMKNKHGIEIKELDLGGGYGVPYVEGDCVIDIEKRIESLALRIKSLCKNLCLQLPKIRIEPGRSLSAEAGMTLYTVGTVKRIKGYKNYVSIDGGMTDNPRYALYGAPYTCYVANKANEVCDLQISLVGRCCESGDIIQEKIMFPNSVTRYDTVAVCTTGAYNYSMASNYNRLPRPPIVMLRGGKESYLAVKRETEQDLLRNDI